MRLFADSSACCGCHACLLACGLHLFGENNPKKAALGIVSHFPVPGGFEVRVCTQCGACADVCPAGAIVRDENDAYRVVPELCTGCLACVDACPEGVVFTRSDVPHVWKCDACGACVAVCGMSALRLAPVAEGEVV